MPNKLPKVDFAPIIDFVKTKQFWIKMIIVIACLSAVFFWYYWILANAEKIGVGEGKQIKVDKESIEKLMILEEERSVLYYSSSSPAFDPFVYVIASTSSPPDNSNKSATSTKTQGIEKKVEATPSLQ
jgi:hypothetical protein